MRQPITHLQHILIGSAINLVQMGRWLTVPKKIVAPKLRLNNDTKRRYCESPCWIPTVSRISAALSKVIRADCCRTALVARKMGTSRS